MVRVEHLSPNDYLDNMIEQGRAVVGYAGDVDYNFIMFVGDEMPDFNILNPPIQLEAQDHQGVGNDIGLGLNEDLAEAGEPQLVNLGPLLQQGDVHQMLQEAASQSLDAPENPPLESDYEDVYYNFKVGPDGNLWAMHVREYDP